MLAQPDVVAWRGEGKKHLYIWFMFESSPTSPRAKILEDRKLWRLFDTLEVADSNRNIVEVWSPAILLTDVVGFHKVFGHLMRQNEEFTTQFWDWHVINYITAIDDGFSDPGPGANYTVLVIFCFGYNITDNARKWFQKFFTSGDPLQPVCDSRIVEHESNTHWKRPEVPFLRSTSALQLFAPFIENDMVLVNVNGGPEITHLGMV